MDKSNLRKSNIQRKQFDGTIFKIMGIFEGTFKTKKHFEMIHIMVVACNKDHGLLRIDVLEVDKTLQFYVIYFYFYRTNEFCGIHF